MGAMKAYNLPQWLMFFYIYCFIGWLWECFYVSVRIKKFTNRGFMHGPLLPIYGSGAISLLFATLPVRNNIILVFVVSVVTATALEFVTGTVMEELFKVRYWDYTRYKYNYKGHICILASTAWGIAGVLLVFVVNRPIERFVLSIPRSTIQLLSFAIAICAACDFGASFREAMDMREILSRMSESTDRQLKRISNRMDAMAAFYGEELRESVGEHMEQIKNEYLEKVDNFKASGIDRIDRAKDKLELLTDAQKRRLIRFINANPDAESKFNSVSEVLGSLKEKAGIIMHRVKPDDKQD